MSYAIIGAVALVLVLVASIGITCFVRRRRKRQRMIDDAESGGGAGGFGGYSSRGVGAGGFNGGRVEMSNVSNFF